MVRLYYDGPFRVGERIQLEKSEIQYFKKIHRARGEVVIFNRQGQEARGSWNEGAFIISSITQTKSPKYLISVAVGLPENAVIADLVRALSELGVERLVFFGAERSQAARIRKVNLERCERLAIEAARQCGRGLPLEVDFISDLEDLLKKFKDTRLILMDEAGEKGSSKRGELKEPLVLLLGPEGGWTQKERDLMAQQKAQVLHLDTPILRVTTAAIAGVVYVLSQSGAFDASQ